MVVAKLNRTGSVVQFIASEDIPVGTVFQLGRGLFNQLLSGTARGGLVLLSRLPVPVDVKRHGFKPSPLWLGDSGVQSASRVSLDGFSGSFVKERKDQFVGKSQLDVRGKW